MRRNPLKRSKRISTRQQRVLRDMVRSFRAKFKRRKKVGVVKNQLKRG
jgi:hypothetical protein